MLPAAETGERSTPPWGRHKTSSISKKQLTSQFLHIFPVVGRIAAWASVQTKKLGK